MQPTWHNKYETQGLDATREFWLTQQQSTTKLLESIYPLGDLKIVVCKAAWRTANTHDCTYIGVEQQECWIREVLICIKQQPWMWARSVFTKAIIQQSGIDFTQLSTTPLGAVIFKHADLIRSDFNYAVLNAQHADYQLIRQQTNIISPKLWARRSKFSLKQTGFLLYEVLLDKLPPIPS